MKHFDVAIVGLGPVGCAAAILLAHAGMRVVVFERDREVYRLPRAVNMDGEVVRAFQRIGLGEELNALLQPVRPGESVAFTNSKREPIFSNAFTDFGRNGWQPGSFFDQPEVDAWLRARALEHAAVESYVGWQVSGFVEHPGRVELNADELDSDAKVDCSAAYVLACDGASSIFRNLLNINWNSLGYDHDWLVVDIEALTGNTLTTTTMQICDPDRISTYVCSKDPYRRWEFKLNPGETWEEMLEPERIRLLIEAFTPAGTYTIRRAAMYQFHAAVADEWRRSRILLAGDAAHQTPPFLGQGMNAGMRDVINLGWKIPLVLAGVADDALLDTYEEERKAHATDLVDWAVAIGKLMEHLAAVEAAERAGVEPPKPDEDRRASGYGQGRDQPPIRDGVVCLDQVSDSGSTGYLFSQPIVQTAGGDERRLDDLMGPGVCIVGRTEADLVHDAGSAEIIRKLGGGCLEGLTEVRGHFDRLFAHSRAAIVRPDRYVFGHTTADLTLDELISQLADAVTVR